MILLEASLFFGRLHPLVVHLPIGFLILAAVMDLASYLKRFENLKDSVPFVLFLGGLAASFACLLGWLLSTTGDYNANILEKHKYTGIATAALSFFLFYITTPHFKRFIHLPSKIFSILMIGLMGLMSFSGHQGGNLTHGADYLSLKVLTKKKRIPPATVDEAFVYEDVIEPMLEKRCSQCHSGSKIKGELKMESLADLLKGGKNGPAITPNDLHKSELFHRITLEPTDEDFMPSDGKTPLTKNEVEILKWWIEKAGTIDNKTVSELKVDEPTKHLFAVQLGFEKSKTSEGSGIEMVVNPELPLMVDLKAVENLDKAGYNVRIMLHKPLMLDVVLPKGVATSPNEVNQKLTLLKPIAKSVVWLNISQNDLTDEQTSFLKELTNLEKLRLDRNNLGDKTAESITELKHLNSVNFYQTKLTKTGLASLSNLPSIKSIYVFGSMVTPQDTSLILKMNSNLKIVF
jgi:uncharacterized membrane protein